MNQTKSIHRPSLHEELIERLRNLIIEDVLKPDEKVPEKDLCESFGVSRTPLREALKVLASEGLVVLQANPDRMTEAFGLYALSGRATSFLAPFSIAVVTDVTQNMT